MSGVSNETAAFDWFCGGCPLPLWAEMLTVRL